MARAASNIANAGITLRLRRSVYAFAMALAIVALTRGLGQSGWWTLAAGLPFFGAFFLTYQGLFRT